MDEERAALSPEPLLTSLLLLPRRAAFVAVAVVQIAVELAATALQRALNPSND